MVKTFPDIKESEWRWPHFSRREMACKLSGECRMSPDFLDKLEKLRVAYGQPMPVNSGYRSPAHNKAVGGEKDSAHMLGRAVDIQVRGSLAYLLLVKSLEHGFTGIGVKQSGPSRFLHLDDLMPEDGVSTRPWVWSY